MFISTIIVSAALSFNPAIADPTPPKAWASAVVAKTNVCSCECCDGKSCSTKKKALIEAFVDTPKVVQTEELHSMRDNSGQAWTHKDKAYLEQYIQGVNARLAAPRQQLFYFQGGSSCATGTCPR